MKAKPKIRLLIADDHPVVREGLASILSRMKDMEVVATADNGQTALREFRHLKPDITMMDLRMPVMDGLSATREIRKIDPEARVIILTTYDDNEDIYQTMQAGASAYLLKDCARDALLECIRAVHEGKTIIEPQLATKLISRIKDPDLSPRELEVLRSVAAGLANKEIGAALGITEGTVKSHVSHVLRKLGAESRTEAVRFGLERGLVVLEDSTRPPAP